jgi:F-type H+-transporting ATPase subunit a
MKKRKPLHSLVFFVVIFLGLPMPSFASEGEGFVWISLLPFWENLSSLEYQTDSICDFGTFSAQAITHALLVSILLIGVCVYTRFRTPPKVIPSDRVSLGNVLEVVIEFICGIIEDNMGPNGRRFIHIIGAVFIFILVSNLMGILPGFLPPTENININAGCAIIVFFYYQGIGFLEHGPSYLNHFAGPIWWLAPFMFIIELIGHLARPFSLSIRLFGNIMGDHKVLEIFSNLVPLGIPVFNLALGTFVALIQALVFSLLSTIYISLAVDNGEH